MKTGVALESGPLYHMALFMQTCPSGLIGRRHLPALAQWTPDSVGVPLEILEVGEENPAGK